MKEEPTETRIGGEPAVERWIERHLGNIIHLFLTTLAVLLVAAALITAYDTVLRDFPKLWQPTDEYTALQRIIETVLLIAIACELGLLLLFHRTSAAVEVILFVIARKMVSPGVSLLDLLIGTGAVVGLVIMRFHYLSDRPSNKLPD